MTEQEAQEGKSTRVEFLTDVEAERFRQIEKGYTLKHDEEHGIDHLLTWAIEYAFRGEPVKSAALIQAARETFDHMDVSVSDAQVAARLAFPEPPLSTPEDRQFARQAGFIRGVWWERSRLSPRVVVAAPSDTDWMLECSECGVRRDALEELRGTGEIGVQVARDMAAAAGWTSDPANDDDWCSKCSAVRTSRPVQVEITAEVVERACAGFYDSADGLTSWARLVEGHTALAESYRVHMRAALTAALGGGAND